MPLLSEILSPAMSMVKNRKLIKMNFVYTFNLERNPLTVLDLSPNSVLTLSKLSRALVTIFVAGAGGRTLLSPWPFGPLSPQDPGQLLQ